MGYEASGLVLCRLLTPRLGPAVAGGLYLLDAWAWARFQRMLQEDDTASRWDWRPNPWRVRLTGTLAYSAERRGQYSACSHLYELRAFEWAVRVGRLCRATEKVLYVLMFDKFITFAIGLGDDEQIVSRLAAHRAESKEIELLAQLRERHYSGWSAWD